MPKKCLETFPKNVSTFVFCFGDFQKIIPRNFDIFFMKVKKKNFKCRSIYRHRRQFACSFVHKILLLHTPIIIIDEASIQPLNAHKSHRSEANKKIARTRLFKGNDRKFIIMRDAIMCKCNNPYLRAYLYSNVNNNQYTHIARLFGNSLFLAAQ